MDASHEPLAPQRRQQAQSQAKPNALAEALTAHPGALLLPAGSVTLNRVPGCRDPFGVVSDLR